MPMYIVYKKEWCEYSEGRGLVVKSSTPQRAKGIAMAYWEDQDRNNIGVNVMHIADEGIILPTDSITAWNYTNNN